MRLYYRWNCCITCPGSYQTILCCHLSHPKLPSLVHTAKPTLVFAVQLQGVRNPAGYVWLCMSPFQFILQFLWSEGCWCSIGKTQHQIARNAGLLPSALVLHDAICLVDAVTNSTCRRSAVFYFSSVILTQAFSQHHVIYRSDCAVCAAPTWEALRMPDCVWWVNVFIINFKCFSATKNYWCH